MNQEPGKSQPAIELNAGIYALAMLLSSGWIGLTLLDEQRTTAAVVLGVLVLLMLVTRIWLVGPVYFGVLAVCFATEQPLFRSVSDFETPELLFVAASIVFLISGSRYVVLTAPILPYSTLSVRDMLRESYEFVISVFTDKPEGKLTKKARLNTRLEAREKRTVKPEEFLTAAFRILIALFGASLLLQFVPNRPDVAIAEFGLHTTGLRAATLAWVVIGITVVSGLLLTPVGWLRHSSREAGVYLRSVVTRWCFGDLRSIVVRLVKDRQKTTVTKLRRHKPRWKRRVDDDVGAVAAAKERSAAIRLRGRK